MRCVGNGTADRADSSQPLRSHTAPTHAHEHTPRTPTLSGRHTRALTHKDTHSDTHKETLTDSGIFKYRRTLIYRDTANMTHSTEARAESHSNTETLKYRNTLTTETHSDIPTHTRSVRRSATGGQGSAVAPGWGGRQCPSPSPHDRSVLRSQRPEVHHRQTYTNVLTTTCPEV